MMPYLILLAVPSLFAVFNTRQLSLVLWYATFVYFWMFVGLRFEVGPDWVQYSYIHKSIAYYDFWEVIAQSEPLSYLLFWFSERWGLEIYFSNIVAALIMLIGVFAFARRTANPWLALVAATPYFIIVMGMSGMRQTMAAGLILLLFSRWENYRFHSRFFYILVAAMFHTSALINNIFLIVKMNIRLRYKLMFGLAIGFLTVYLATEVETYNIAKYQQRYLEGNFMDRSFGSIYHIAMIAIPAMLGFAFRKKIADNIHNPVLLSFGLYAAAAILLMNFVSPTAASRLTVYLYFLPMMVYPALVNTLGQRAQLGSMIAVIGFHVLILVTWFLLGNHAFAYENYKNIMFDDF